MLAIELNSGGHVVLEGAETALVPALAVLEPPALLLGATAARRARLAPLFVSRAHWEHPGSTPLARGLPGATTHGEVAFAQLRELWPVASRTGAVAVSPATSPDDLGQLAGLFQAADREPLVWVDAAVAGTAERASTARALWVEAEAGRTVLAELQREPLVAGWQVRRTRVEVSRAVGTSRIDDAVARAIANHFLRVARFDPLAVAATEQELYDSLSGVQAALAGEAPVVVVLGSGHAAREATIDRAELALACQALVAEVLRLVQSARRAGEPLTVHVGARLANLPGLVAALRALPDLVVDQLPLAAAATGAMRLAGTLETGTAAGARWLLAAPTAAPVELQAASLTADDVPTHVLWQGRAWPLSSVPLVLGRAPGATGLVLEGPPAGLSREHCQLLRVGNEAVVEDLSTYGTWLNGERVRRRSRLRAGDVLRLGVPGVELVLLAVQSAAPGEPLASGAPVAPERN
jgi:hypothetical protein